MAGFSWGAPSSPLMPPSLQIEVTETVLLDRSADDVVPALWRLIDEGVRIALDDFGTGYASLADLNEFPVDCKRRPGPALRA